MKIVVDKMPTSPKDCLFSERIVTGHVVGEVYGCNLRPVVEKFDSKPRCLCKSVENCTCLEVVMSDDGK